MARRLPPLTWLRAFEAAARHLSFTQAASELRLTQTAVSKQVKLLEQHFGEALFFRKPRSLVLTEIGAAYLPRLKDNFARLAAATDEVFGDQGRNTLNIRIAAGFSANWLAPRLHDFINTHQDLSIRLISSLWGEEFDRERLDLDIQYGTGHWPGFASDQLTHDNLFPVCSPQLIEHNPSIRVADDLATQNLLHVLGYEEGWAEWLAAAGATKVHPGQGVQVDTSLMAFTIAKTGGGVALARSSLAAGLLESGELVKPFELEIKASENFYLLRPDGGQRHPHAESFRSWLLDQAGLDAALDQEFRPKGLVPLETH